MHKLSFCLAAWAVIVSGVAGAEVESKISPDGRNEIRLETGSGMTIQVFRDGKALMRPSPISMTFDGRGTLGTSDGVVDNWKVELLARNDGVAYRFVTSFAGEVRVMGEEASLNVNEGQIVWAAYNNDPWNDDPLQNSWEKPAFRYAVRDMSTATDNLYFAPILFEFEGAAMAVTESDLRDYAGLNYRRAAGDHNRLASVFATWPTKWINQNWPGKNWDRVMRYKRIIARENYLVETAGTRTYPWRVFLLADKPVDLIGNTLVNDLASPNEIGDTSWIKPGKVAWDWWNHWNVEGAGEERGPSTEVYKKYIDFASKKGIEYVIFDEGWSETLNIWKVQPKMDLPYLMKYAAERKVGIILWMAWAQLDGREEEAVKLYTEMGAKGFKVDFMDRDDALCLRFYERFAKVCAKYHAIVDYHGAFKPTGLQVTYPNILNFEGVAGLENMKWAISWDQVVNDCTIPFTRGLAGPMDYTPGAMDNYARGTYVPTEANPGSLGTRCHQIALMGIFDAPFEMLCDSPVKYEANAECCDYMVKVPVKWDEAKGLAGEVGAYCVVARRAGDVWYLAAIGDWQAREVTVKLDFLGTGAWTADIMEDGAEAQVKPTSYVHRSATVQAGEAFTFKLASGGGFMARLEAAK